MKTHRSHSNENTLYITTSSGSKGMCTDRATLSISFKFKEQTASPLKNLQGKLCCNVATAVLNSAETAVSPAHSLPLCAVRSRHPAHGLVENRHVFQRIPRKKPGVVGRPQSIDNPSRGRVAPSNFCQHLFDRTVIASVRSRSRRDWNG